ncbi:hypothetical protein BLNAU_20437 [Blattamonas nauphoetae]|uniref:Uncharacterized protein n=1 Tax=Blattamonas nauphoetae TaxID=2049346 RepID=A0ABQ9WZ78_9EUKA|nr:hypothetical protein BLNAU_20437 [Blattamonas nauphoetae]
MKIFGSEYSFHESEEGVDEKEKGEEDEKEVENEEAERLAREKAEEEEAVTERDFKRLQDEEEGGRNWKMRSARERKKKGKTRKNDLDKKTRN